MPVLEKEEEENKQIEVIELKEGDIEIKNMEGLQYLSSISDGTIDLILTDPPFNISRPSNFTKNSDNNKFNNISIDFGDWDQEEIDDAYRRYDPDKYKKQHNPQGGDQNALI